MDHRVSRDRTESVALERLLLAVRRRVWSLQMMGAGRSLLWHTGFLLLALATVHLFVTPMTGTWLLAGVAVPALLMLYRISGKRPSLAQAAARADREFRGHALLTTAVECLQSPTTDDSEATRTVLLQAEHAAQTWLPEVSQRFGRPPGTAIVIAGVPLFVALMLLSLPGARNGTENDALTVNVSLDHDDERVANDTNDAAALRRIIVDESAASTRPTTDQQNTDSTKTLVPEQYSATEEVTELAEMSGQTSQSAGVAGSSGNDGDLPGNAIARSMPRTVGTNSTGNFTGREIVELQRTGTNVSAGANAGTSFSASKPWHLASPDIIQAAAPPESQTGPTMLSRAQAAHARLYLQEPGKTDE